MSNSPEQRRIERLKELMHEKGVDVLLVTGRENVRYLTGFTGSAGYALIASGRPRLITDFRYKLQAGAETSGVAVVIQKTDWMSALRDAAARLKIRTVWFDETRLTIDVIKRLRKLGLRLRGHRDLVGDLRQRKDEHELASIRAAIRRAEDAYIELKRHIKPGAVERDIGLRLEYLIREKGSRRPPFEIIVASGKNGAMPHATVTNRRIREGDLVIIDFGAEADGYFSDITRTVCAGRPSGRQRVIHEIVLRAQRAAIEAIRPGASCKSVDDAARGVIKNEGHGKRFGHATGHGVGLMVHEAPAISALSKAVVDRGMVFTVEPGVYIPGWGGVRIEDMAYVTDKGAKVLTTLPKDL